MITIRAYWSQAEAALAKSVLDNYEIPCALLHENANLYGRAPFAMPVRLVAVEDRAEWAAYVLSSDFEAAAKIEEIAAEMPPPRIEGASPGLVKDSPWELLMIAFYFFVPGICFLHTEYPAKLSYNRAARAEIAAVVIAHFLGWIAIAFAILLVALFWYALRSLAGTQTSAE
jgi:hypothetical protein